MKRNYIDIKETLLKYEMYYIFCAISYVYGNESLNKFVSYVKKIYDLDSSYNSADIIEVMEKDELIMNIIIFFDSEDKRHISEIGIKDTYLNELILCLKRNVPYTYNEITTIPTYNEWIIFEEGCELPNEWEGVIVAAPQHKSKTMHCVYIDGQFHSLGIKDQIIIPKKFMRINVSNITKKDAYTFGKKVSKE